MTDPTDTRYWNVRDADGTVREEEFAAEIERLRAEVYEQCRLNGMGAEREANLISEKDRLKLRVAELEDTLRNYVP